MIYDRISEARNLAFNSYPGSQTYDVAMTLCLHRGIGPRDIHGPSGMSAVQNIIYETALMRMITP